MLFPLTAPSKASSSWREAEKVAPIVLDGYRSRRELHASGEYGPIECEASREFAYLSPPIAMHGTSHVGAEATRRSYCIKLSQEITTPISEVQRK